jgi:3',5'-cyclic-AMP phosphodiesterase
MSRWERTLKPGQDTMKIAHLSDLHLLEDSFHQRPWATRFRAEFLSVGRPLDPKERRNRFRNALRSVRESGAEHLIITGDLTEDGVESQFEVVAELLHESGLDPETITLIPGNHDAYHEPELWRAALNGPLSAFRMTSQPGSVLRFQGVTIIPVSTVREQHYLFSAGAMEDQHVKEIAQVVANTRHSPQPVILAQHHPPRRTRLRLMEWFDGLRPHSEFSNLLHHEDHLFVLHGHTHVSSSKPMKPGGQPRIFCCPAVVDSEQPLRLYHVAEGGIHPYETENDQVPHGMYVPALT